MDMSTDQLPCGADIDAMIEQVTDGRAGERTAHQQACPHCQAALAEHDRLWSSVHDLAAGPVQAPDGIVEHVLRQIRGLSRDPTHARLPGPRGETRIADHVIAVTARVTTDSVPGVRAALARSRTDDPDVVAGVAGTSTAVHITLAATYGHDLYSLAQRIRTTVSRRIRAVTGLHPVEITIVIDDVLEPWG
jgi:uncharacterized alkaline shock family protein YloU